jgi:hypothetical protein
MNVRIIPEDDENDLHILALPAFEWVEPRCTRAHNTAREP